MIENPMDDLLEIYEVLSYKPDLSSESRIRKCIDEEFKSFYNFFSEHGYSAYTEIVSLSGDGAARRKQVLYKNIPRIREKYGRLSLRCVEQTYIHFNTYIVNNYCHQDIDYNFLLGAALWILDDIRHQRKMTELDQFLTDSEKDLGEVNIPWDLYHPFYSQELIKSVMYILLRRNDDPDDPFQDAQTAKNIVPNTSHRRNYEGLISLLDNERIGTACQHYHELQEEAEERYMQAMAVYEGKEQVIAEELKQITAPARQGVLFVHQEILPLEQAEDIIFRCDEISDLKTNFQAHYQHYLYDSYSTVREAAGYKKVARIFSDFTVEDPYELCFALIYLLASGNEEPWLLGPGCLLMNAVGRELPWFQASDEQLWDDDDLTLYYNGWNEQIPAVPEGTFSRKYKDGFNAPQLIYRMSGGVIPTAMHPFAKEKAELIEDGKEPKEAEKMTSVAEAMFLQQFQASQNIGVRPL